uniref:titin homolog isoform X2 n=1 Tax=Pristiophorus japonicus TaxID=55135 RepID=UPI00398EAEDC
MGNESSSVGDQPKATDKDKITLLPPNQETTQDSSKAHKKKNGPLNGSHSSKYGKNEQNVNEELPGLKNTGKASDQANTSPTHPAPGLQGDNIVAPAAQSASPKTGDNDDKSPETNTENSLNSTSREILVGQKEASAECEEKANLQITADPKSPLLSENKNSLWSLLDDAAFEGDALKVNNIFGETETTWAADTGQSPKASSSQVQGNTAVSAAEERLSDLLYHGEQLDGTDEQGSYPSPQGTVGGDQLPAQETECGLVLPAPGCKESIIEEKPAKSTDGKSDLLMVEIQDPKYLTPASLEKHAEYVTIAGHNVVGHSRAKVENEQLTEEVVTDQEEKCVLPKVNLKEGSISVSEYVLNLSEGVAREGSELSLSCDTDHHQTSNSEENDCSLLTSTENQRSPAKMELLSIDTSDLDIAKLNATLLAVSDEQQKTHNTKEQENISTENACSLVTRIENIPETVVPSSSHQNPSSGRTKEKLKGFSCDSEQGQICNQETKTNACKGGLGSLEMQLENTVFPINPQNLDALEPKETALFFKSEQQICTSESKGNVCEDYVWNLQEITKSAPSYQNTYSEKALDEPLGCCCDDNQQTRGSEKQAKASEDKLFTVRIDTENYSFPETSKLTHCQDMDLVEVKQMLLGFQNDQQVCSTEKQDGRSEKNGRTLQSGPENGLLSDRMGLSSSSQDPDSMEVKGEQLNLTSSSEQQEDTSEIQNQVCEGGLSEEGLSFQENMGIESKLCSDMFGLTPSSETPDTLGVNEILVLSAQQPQTGTSMTKENDCEGIVCSPHDVRVELSPSSQIPGTDIPKETLLSVANKQLACGSEKQEEALKGNQCELQTRLESSMFPESSESLLNLQNCGSKEATTEKLSDFRHFTGQTSTCSTETLYQEDLSNIQIKNIIIPAAMQLPAGSDFTGTAEMKKSLMSVSSEQTCSGEKQEKVSEENVCSPPATMESTLFSETADLPLAPQNIGSTGTENEQSPLSHGSVQQTAEREIKENPSKGEVCSFQTDRQDTISERVESLLVSQHTAGAGVKEALLTVSGDQLQTFVSEEQQKDYEGNVCSLQKGPEDTVPSTSTELAPNPQDAAAKDLLEGFAHEQQQLCGSEFKVGLDKKDSDSPPTPVENIIIPEVTKLPFSMQNPDAVELGELLKGFSNEQQQASSEVAKERDFEENIQKLLTDITKVIATSMDLSPSSAMPSIDEQTETEFSQREQQTCDREKVSEDDICNFPIGTETSLFQLTKELAPTTQNIGSIATENEQLLLSYDNGQETANGEIEENVSKEKVFSFPTDRGDMISDRVDLLPVSQHTAGLGVTEASLTVSGEELQMFVSEEQQKDYEGNVCSLQKGPEDTVPSTSTELAPNPQDAAAKELLEGFAHEQQQLCGSEFKVGLYKKDSDSPPTPVENIIIPEVTKLPFSMQNPDAVELGELLKGFSNEQQQASSEVAKERDFEENIQKLLTDIAKVIATSMDLSPSSAMPSIDEQTETVFSQREQQTCDREKVSEDDICNFPIGTETSLFQLTKELAPTTQNIGSIATENEQLLLSYDNGQETANGEIEENVSKEKVFSFPTDRGDMISDRVDLLPVSQHTAGPGVNEASLTFSGEELQMFVSKEQQKDSEGDMCSLQKGPEDIVPSASTELAPNPQDATTKAETSEGFECSAEQQQMCDTEFKHGLPNMKLDQSQISLENIFPREARKLSIDIENPDVEEQSDTLVRFNRQWADGETKEKVFEANEENHQIEAGNISEVLKSPASCQDPDATKLKETIIGFSSEHQQVDDNGKLEMAEENLCCFHTAAESMDNVLTLKATELLRALQDPGTSEMKEELWSFGIDRKPQQIATKGIEDNYYEEKVGCLQQGEENIPEPATTECTAQYPNTEALKARLMNFNCDVDHQRGNATEVNVCADSMSSLQVGMKPTLPESITCTPSPPIPQALEENDRELEFSNEQQQIYSSPTEENIDEDNVCSLMSVIENVTALPIDLSAGSEDHHTEEAKENTLGFSCETDKQEKCNDEMKEETCEENVHSFQLDAADTLPVSTEQIPTVVTPSTAEVKEASPGFIHEKHQICINEAKENVCEENLCMLQIVQDNIVLSEVIELTPGSQSTDTSETSKETLLAVVSEQLQTGVSVMKDSVSDNDMGSLQSGTEHTVPAATMELTASLQSRDEEKGEETLQSLHGDLKQEHLLNNESKENLHEENMSKTSTEDIKLSVSMELTDCTHDLNTAVLPECVTGFSGEHQAESMDKLQVGSANNLFAEIIKLIPGIQIRDAKDVKDIPILGSEQQQQMCSSVIKEEEANGKTVHVLQSAVENIIIPESMKLASAPQDSEASELMAFSDEQQQICSSGMETETCKGDYIENNLYPDITMMLPSSPPKKDNVDFREKLSDGSWNTEQQNWNVEVQDNVSEKNMLKLKTNMEMTTPAETIKLPSNLQIHELENEKDYLLASTLDGDTNQISSGEPKEKVFEEDVKSVKMGRESISPEANKLTPMPQDPDIELKGTSLDFENEQQHTCNTESKERINLPADTDNISAQETFMKLLFGSQKFDTEKDEDKLLGFSHDTEQLTCNGETEINIFKENACIDKMGMENSVQPESVKLLPSSDTATELQETTNNSFSDAQQISTTEREENFCVENVHSLENIIPESNELSSNSLDSDTTIKEDILRQRHDSEKQQTLNLSGKERVYANGVGSMETDMTFGIGPEIEFPHCNLSVSEAVEIKQLLATTSDSEQQQTNDNLISHSICKEKVSLEMDFALESDKLPEAVEKETISAGDTDYKNDAAAPETRLTKSMTSKSKERSNSTEHLLLFHTRDATESCLEIDAKEQENIVGVPSTGNFAGIDQTSIKKSYMSETKFGNECLFAIEPTTRPGGRSPHTLADVKNEGVLPAACENTEVRIIENGLKEGLKIESPSPESASSSSALGKDAVGVICTVTTGALDKGIMTTSISLESEKEESVPALLLLPVAPDPPQHTECTTPLYDAELLQNHLEQTPLSVSLESEKEESVPAFLLLPVAPDPSTTH